MFIYLIKDACSKSPNSYFYNSGKVTVTNCTIFDCPEQPTISDSTAGGLEPDSITFEMCAKLIDDHVLVSEEEIKQAMRLLIEKERWIVEGAAGVALAALLKERERFAGKRVVVVLCGRNIAAEKLREIL